MAGLRVYGVHRGQHGAYVGVENLSKPIYTCARHVCVLWCREGQQISGLGLQVGSLTPRHNGAVCGDDDTPHLGIAWVGSFVDCVEIQLFVIDFVTGEYWRDNPNTLSSATGVMLCVEPGAAALALL